MSRKESSEDIYDYRYALETSLKSLDRSEILSLRDKELIRGFIQHLRAKRVSTGRLAKYAFTVRSLTEHLGVHVEDAGRRDIEKLSIWVQEKGYSPHTVWPERGHGARVHPRRFSVRNGEEVRRVGPKRIVIRRGRPDSNREMRYAR